MVSLLLRSCSPTVAVSKPSIKTEPADASRTRNNAKVKEDLPAPVLPTTANCEH